MDFIEHIRQEMKLTVLQVTNTVELLQNDNTIPFIARYRKEMTGNLDEVQIEQIHDRYTYLKEMEDRRQTILQSIESQGKLTPELRQSIIDTTTKQQLEDLYLPYKPKRRTRGMIAKEKGLEPLAVLLASPQARETQLQQWFSEFKETQTAPMTLEEAMKGARDIVAEWISEDAETLVKLRELTFRMGTLISKVKSEFEGKTSKFEMYYDFSELIREIPAHRYLAIRRGEKEEVLRVSVEVEEVQALEVLRSKWLRHSDKFLIMQMELCLQDSWNRLLSPAIETDIRLNLKTDSDETSIDMFSKNLRQLLLLPPGKNGVVLGLDPGFRTGTKLVVVDNTGKLLHHSVIFPVPPQNHVAESQKIVKNLISTYQVDVICIGNGTASREVSQFVRDLLKTVTRPVEHVVVNESGASVYSASEMARKEFPDLDVSYRGAISIARRYQDPLAELVKIDPKSIGVGQYQHDVNQTRLKQSLDRCVESCVNYVGVDLNRASMALLSYVSGISKTLAQRIVDFRDQNGPFRSREQIRKVTGFGPKTFEQSAGFLKIADGDHVLDRSSVHPERYGVVEKIASDHHISVDQLIGNVSVINNIPVEKYIDASVGAFTLKDILEELRKPGRDPRTDHETIQFNENIQEMTDLHPGMKLNGVVTNVTHFGAFVDVGVHQDGLIHISEMSDRFIANPLEACSVGQKVVVYVKEVDVERHRISLSMKPGGNAAGKKTGKPKAEKAPAPVSGDFQSDLVQLMQKFNR
ncbi:MAG: RNA-binding transcriptional accessory protein [SAR324 cluster bacterium]|nr:RNA-binding transcriptional accessory protein [SAR324 cluster bacterium]